MWKGRSGTVSLIHSVWMIHRRCTPKPKFIDFLLLNCVLKSGEWACMKTGRASLTNIFRELNRLVFSNYRLIGLQLCWSAKCSLAKYICQVDNEEIEYFSRFEVVPKGDSWLELWSLSPARWCSWAFSSIFLMNSPLPLSNIGVRELLIHSLTLVLLIKTIKGP